MPRNWPGNPLETVWNYVGYPITSQDAKAAGGAKMGDTNWKTELEAIGKAMDAQNCVIQRLRDEIEQLRKLVREAYEEGYITGRTARAGHPEEWWETSNAKKALDNAP